jgi:DNA-binding CsgD family transcriptional regulator/tetratricopeptide (TPR) repeat protein
VQVARTLLESGAGVERVAEQLLATGDHDILAEQWVLSWLVDAGSRLVNRAPDSAAELLRAALEQLPADEPRAEELSGHLLNALWLNRRDAEAEQLARQILPQGRDPERIGAAAWRMVSSINRGGRYQESLEAGEKALADGVVTGRWSTRLRTLQALSLFMLGEHEQSMAICEAALAEAEQAADGFAAGWALHVLSFNRMNDRDHAGAIECCRRALDALGTDLEGSDLRMLVMSNHAAALNDADRLAEAREAFSEAIRLAEHAAPARLAMSRVQAAAQLFECGAWDDVLAELKDLQLGSSVMQDVVPQILRARIALHRDDMAAAGPALRAVEAAHRGSPWSAQAMMDAHAETAEHAGEPRKLLVALAPLFDPTQASYVVQSQWLPAAVRAALAVGDAATARTAERAAADEAARSGTPTVRAIAEHSRGLLAGDGAVLRAAAEMFAEVGRPLPAAQAFEDAAVAFAEAGDAVAARTAVAAALARYAALGATHDTRRTKARLRAHGLRLVQQEPARRPATGWEALTPAEVQVVDLLRVGRSNPDIAAELFLSRRTVESHVSRILTKLGAKSRLEVIAAARPAAPSG